MPNQPINKTSSSGETLDTCNEGLQHHPNDESLREIMQEIEQGGWDPIEDDG